MEKSVIENVFVINAGFPDGGYGCNLSVLWSAPDKTTLFNEVWIDGAPFVNPSTGNAKVGGVGENAVVIPSNLLPQGIAPNQTLKVFIRSYSKTEAVNSDEVTYTVPTDMVCGSTSVYTQPPAKPHGHKHQ